MIRTRAPWLGTLLLAACSGPSGGVDSEAGLAFAHHPGRAFVLDAPAGRVVARLDFDGDGLDDLLVGAADPDSDQPTPLRVLVSLGDGRFEDRTADHLGGAPAAATPLGLVADLDGEGPLDVVVLDAGHLERGQSPSGGFYGERPWLLSSGDEGRWSASDGLYEAVRAADPNDCWPRCTGALHAKALTAGDVDGDGDVDLFVESGGGFENPNPHLMLNLGAGRFAVDASPDRLDLALIRGDTGSWRYASHRLVDVDGDGHLDLVMGQLRKRDNGQDSLRNRVALNDGAGRFALDRTLDLPYADFDDGYTYVKAMAALDLDEDGRADLVLSHERSNRAASPDPIGNTGRYLQVLLQRDAGFEDHTPTWLGDQSATTPAEVAPYGRNDNAPAGLELVDLDGDGRLDLFCRDAGPVGRHAPLAYMRRGDRFVPVDPAAITRDDWFSERAWPIDLNGDGTWDYVHADWTGDETRFVPTLVERR